MVYGIRLWHPFAVALLIRWAISGFLQNRRSVRVAFVNATFITQKLKSRTCWLRLLCSWDCSKIGFGYVITICECRPIYGLVLLLTISIRTHVIASVRKRILELTKYQTFSGLPTAKPLAGWELRPQTPIIRLLGLGFSVSLFFFVIFYLYYRKKVIWYMYNIVLCSRIW